MRLQEIAEELHVQLVVLDDQDSLGHGVVRASHQRARLGIYALRFGHVG
jgi:hypothetical protein